tara:strand:+ start:916 stop:1110 length:195 start_codon:yes stop_codon:yes gene_type:complete
MKYFNIIWFIFVISCSTNNVGNFWDEKNLNKDIKIVVNENLEFDEFKKKMKVYLDRSKYPDIND